MKLSRRAGWPVAEHRAAGVLQRDATPVRRVDSRQWRAWNPKVWPLRPGNSNRPRAMKLATRLLAPGFLPERPGWRPALAAALEWGMWPAYRTASGWRWWKACAEAATRQPPAREWQWPRPARSTIPAGGWW